MIILFLSLARGVWGGGKGSGGADLLDWWERLDFDVSGLTTVLSRKRMQIELTQASLRFGSRSAA
jgi:hypothetical protein